MISALDPQAVQRSSVAWVSSIVTFSKGDVVSIDGKWLCGSGQDGKEASMHMVSAWSSANHLVQGSYKTDDKSNEITAIAKLLEMLDLAERTVTIDTTGYRTAIGQKIVDGQAHYVLTVKDNQAHLPDDIKKLLPGQGQPPSA